MISRIRSLAVVPRGSVAGHGNAHAARLALRQALRGQHVLDFRCADAEGQRAERAVRAGVAVAADDGLARAA